MMKSDLAIAVYADCALPEDIRKAAALPVVSGLTTNPSLVSVAGVTDYQAYARTVLELVPTWPVSFEVLSDDEEVMEDQARIIATWSDNVYVKIPVVSAAGASRANLVRRLSQAGVRCNVTCVFTPDQAAEASQALDSRTRSIISVFAGRAADAGHDPVALMRECRSRVDNPAVQLLWASTREAYNVLQARDAGCAIITAPLGIIAKVASFGADLHSLSVTAVRSFLEDIHRSGVDFS